MPDDIDEGMPDNIDEGTDRNLNEEDVSIIMGTDTDTDTEESGPSRGKRRRALSGRRLPDSENDEV